MKLSFQKLEKLTKVNTHTKLTKQPKDSMNYQKIELSSVCQQNVKVQDQSTSQRTELYSKPSLKRKGCFKNRNPVCLRNLHWARVDRDLRLRIKWHTRSTKVIFKLSRLGTTQLRLLTPNTSHSANLDLKYQYQTTKGTPTTYLSQMIPSIHRPMMYWLDKDTLILRILS